MKVKWRSMACICFLPVACIGCSGKNESLVSVQQKNRRVREGFLVRLRQYKVNRSKVNQSLRSLMPRSLRLALAFVFIAAAAHLSAQTAMPISGQAVPSLAQLDTIMQQYMTQYNSPGGNLSVSVDGRLVFARGYGFADTSTGEFVQPDSRMRLASNSKIITAVGILKLIEQGKLSLSTQPFASILKDLKPPSGTTEDPRIQNITISQLLQHTAGYDDGPGYPFDPANDYTTNRNAANAAGLTGAACTPAALISYELGVSLQHDPGATYAYSNLGYLTLGYIIEQVTGIPYATWIEQNIFSIGKMNQTLPAGNLASQKLPYEVAYYGYPGEPLGPSMVPPVGTQVPYEYGAYDLSLELANGGWISTPMDLLRLWDTLNGQYSYNILVGPQTSRVGDVPPLGQGYFYNFYGSLPGTNSLVHLNTSSQMVGNVVYSAIFNTRDKNNAFQPESDADNAIQAYLKTVKSWPTGDLFPTYSTSGTACAFTLPTASTSATVNGQSGFVQLTDANYCAWGATSNASWIHITTGGPFADSGSAGYSVDANSGGARTGTITLAGQTFTVNQVGTATPTTLALKGTGKLVGSTETVTLTATLSPYTSNGNSSDGEIITFQNGGNNAVLGTAKLTGGVATLTATVPDPKLNQFTASYPGDTYLNASSSPQVAITPSSTSATVSPSSLNFPSTAIGATSATQSSTFTNTGTTTLTIGLLTVNGPFTQTNTCGGSVAAGVTCTFSVAYKPTVAGNATGSVDISDEAGDQIITLNGTTITEIASTTTAVTSTLNPSTLGTSVTFTAMVTSTSTGTNGHVL
jgi:CubicO group peptidase (beta-lactamase class C family)